MTCEDVPEDFNYVLQLKSEDLGAELPLNPARVLTMLVAQLEAKQQTTARCRQRALAITKLEEAQHWLQAVSAVSL